MGTKLSDQTAVVTGAGRGIGRAIAVGLASEGAAVTCVARTDAEIDETVAAITAHGGRAQSLSCDVTDPSAAETIITAANDWAGPVDVLVNNAATLGPLGWFVDTEVEDWIRCIELNFNAAVRLSHAAATTMAQRGGGRIISLSTVGAGFPAIPPLGNSAYFVSKTALARFTELIAAELEAHGVYAFAVDPGAVATRLVEEGANSGAGVPGAKVLARALETGRTIPPEVPASFCVRLAAGEGDALTGLQLRYDADLAAMTENIDHIRESNALTLRFQP